MQQQPNTTTSNVQIKLISDARKLLEKVRSQQVLSADSSFDSSFLFDPLHDSKGVMEMKKESSSGEEKFPRSHKNLEIILSNSNLSSVFNSKLNEIETRSNSFEQPTSKPQSTSSSSINEGPKRQLKENDSNGYVVNEDSKNLEEIHEENVKLHIENYQLKEEMNDFEYKLSCLEHTLGIIQEVERSSLSGKERYGEYDQKMQKNPPKEASNTIAMREELQPGVSIDHDPRLSPVTALVADAIIDGAGVKDVLFTKSSSGINAPPPTPLSKSQERELQILRENNEKMVTAIRALAQATIAQTRKHYLYKKRHHMTRKMVTEESEKTNQVLMERDQLQSEFYETRTNYLKEKDIREELSNEVQLLAKKNNVMRKDKQKQEEIRMKVLERIESRDDATVLSRLSQSSCFPVLQSITESNQTQKENIARQNNNDKTLEKLVFKLISQLKKRDTKIEKLEKNLKMSMQYLQGVLELEVKRQDAELALSEEHSKQNVLTIERIEV